MIKSSFSMKSNPYFQIRYQKELFSAITLIINIK